MNWGISEWKTLQPARLTMWRLLLRCKNPGQAELLETEQLSRAQRRGGGLLGNPAARRNPVSEHRRPSMGHPCPKTRAVRREKPESRELGWGKCALPGSVKGMQPSSQKAEGWQAQGLGSALTGGP